MLVEEYGKGERTRNLVYVLVDVGNMKRVANILKMHQTNERLGRPRPRLVVIDAKPRSAASTYVGSCLDMEGLLIKIPTQEEISDLLSELCLDDAMSLVGNEYGFDLDALADGTQRGSQ